MECEDKLPPFRRSWRNDYELGALFANEATEDKYYRVAREMAGYYNITLCDSAEAQLIGQHAHSFAFQGRSISELYIPIVDDVVERDMPGAEDFARSRHLAFLRDYLQLHGLTYRDVSPGLHVLFTDTGQGLMSSLWDDFKVSASDVVNEIRRLTAKHSVPDEDDAIAKQASEGGTIIVGNPFAFPACRPAEARAFRSKAQRRVAGYWSKAANGTAKGGTPKRANDRYQVNKCGRTEYSLNSEASAQSHRPLADGLAPSKPPRAKAGYGEACCILEAKYVGAPKTTPYQERRDFLRGTNSGWMPKKLRNLSRPARIAYWEGIRGAQAGQLGLYLGAMADHDIPYWSVVYICSRDSCRDYFRDLIKLARLPRSIAKACTSSARKTTGENWIV